MLRTLLALVVVLLPLLASEPVDFVDPNIGGMAHMLAPALPNVQLPHGLVRLAPITPPGVKDRYLADQVYGFRAGASLMMPSTIKGEPAPARLASVYDHDQETATPYYYSALLEDTGIRVEYTVSHSVAYYRFTFPETGDPQVFFSLAKGGMVSIAAPDAVIGSEETPRSAGRVYFYAWFSRPFSASHTWSHPDNLGAAVTLPARRIEARIGVSYISTEQARRNILREVPEPDFDRVRSAARAAWNRELAKIEIRGGTDAQRTIFYTALYRAMGRPNNLVEGDRYFSGADHKEHPANGRGFYPVNNLWGSYRSLHPLQLLLDPARQTDFVRSYLRVDEQSGWMQGWARPGMIGHHQAALIADLWFKGYRDFDLAKAYDGLRKLRMETTMIPWRRGPATPLDRAYQELGFVPALAPGEPETVPEVDSFERRQSVSVTLEAAYDDWCMSQLAHALNKPADEELFRKRACNWQNVFDTRTGFVRPKTANGRWIEPFNPIWSGGQGGRDYFTEMNSWIYTWHVQQDVAGLIQAMGGREPFTRPPRPTLPRAVRRLPGRAEIRLPPPVSRSDRPHRPVRPRQRTQPAHPVSL